MPHPQRWGCGSPCLRQKHPTVPSNTSRRVAAVANPVRTKQPRLLRSGISSTPLAARSMPSTRAIWSRVASWAEASAGVKEPTTGASRSAARASTCFRTDDYYGPTEPSAVTDANGIRVRLAQSLAVGKPIVGGEVGIRAGIASGCMTSGLRAKAIDAKGPTPDPGGEQSPTGRGNSVPSLVSSCSYDVSTGRRFVPMRSGRCHRLSAADAGSSYWEVRSQPP